MMNSKPGASTATTTARGVIHDHMNVLACNVPFLVVIRGVVWYVVVDPKFVTEVALLRAASYHDKAVSYCKSACSSCFLKTDNHKLILHELLCIRFGNVRSGGLVLIVFVGVACFKCVDIESGNLDGDMDGTRGSFVLVGYGLCAIVTSYEPPFGEVWWVKLAWFFVQGGLPSG